MRVDRAPVAPATGVPVTTATKTPSFSIATPTLDSLDKLKRCVGSVRGQRGASVEHLVQDADSRDGTPAWLRAQPDLGWRSEADCGMYDAIGRAWARSTGEVLSWLNADEQYLPRTLAFVKDYFDKHPEVDALFGDAIVVDTTGKAVALRREIGLRSFYVANTFLNSMSCTLFFRRSLYDRGLLAFDKRLRYAGDMELILGLLRAGVRIRHVRRYLALFGIDGGNLSGHPAMREETYRVGRAFGGYKTTLAPLLASGCRRIERLVSCCYVPRDVSYGFAIDATPNYVRVDARQIPGRYRLPIASLPQGASATASAANPFAAFER